MTFLVLAHHRSGSNFLTEVLERHPKVTIVNEPFSMHTQAFKEVDLIRWETQPPVEFVDAERGAISFAEELFNLLRSTSRGLVRGFKETMLFEKLRWVSSQLPGLRLILGVRDPRAVVNSVLRHPNWQDWLYHASVPRYCTQIETGRTWDPITLISTSWAIRYYEALTFLRGASVPHVIVRLEDLIRQPEIELDSIMNLLGLDVDRAQGDFINKSSSRDRGGLYSPYRERASVLHGWRTGLKPTQAAQVVSIAGELMEELGYL